MQQEGAGHRQGRGCSERSLSQMLDASNLQAAPPLDSAVCAAAAACHAQTLSDRRCVCGAWSATPSLIPFPNTDACSAGGACDRLNTTSNLRLAHVNADFGGPCFRLAIHQRRYSPSGGWLPLGDYVSDSIRLKGFWEFKDAGALERFANVTLPRNGTLLDVGAHVGYFSLLFAARGFRVHAVEPLPTNGRALQTSLCLDAGLRSRVTLWPVALSSAGVGDKRCVLRSGAANRGNARMLCSRRAHCGGRPAETMWGLCAEPPVATLDDLLRVVRPASVDVFKLDVEGGECAVLQGGQTLFTRYRPRLLLVEAQFGKVLLCLARQAAAHRYHMHARVPKGNAALGLAALRPAAAGEARRVTCEGGHAMCAELLAHEADEGRHERERGGPAPASAALDPPPRREEA